MIRIDGNNVSQLCIQFTAYNMLSQRALIQGKHEKLEVEREFYLKSIDSIVAILGGISSTREYVRWVLRWRSESIPSWVLDNFVYVNGAWHYNSGQSYPDEIQVRRTHLLRMYKKNN